MARQLRKSGTSSPPSTPKKESKPVKEPKEKKGLFTGLLGGNKQKLKSSNNGEDSDEDDDEVVTKVKPKKKKSEPTLEITESETKQETSVKKEVSGIPKKKDIVANYTQNKMEQNVFLYASSKYFISIQDHYNKNFKDITVVGTSALDLIIDEYSKRTICNCLLLFILDDSEVNPIYNLLSSMGLEQLDRRLMNILIVRDKTVDISKITSNKTFKSFISTATVQIDEDSPLTVSILDQAISAVVQNQPVHVPKKEIQKPQQIKSQESSFSKLHKIDILALQDKIKMVKDNNYGITEKNKITQSIITSNGTSNVMDTIDEIQHVKLINAVEQELDKHLETMKKSPHLRGEIQELIENKFLLATLKSRELESMLSEIVSRAESKIERSEQNMMRVNQDIFEELKAADAEVEDIQKKREEVKREILNNFKDYKSLISIISNTSTVQARILGEGYNAIKDTIETNQDIIPTETISTMTLHAKQLIVDRKNHLTVKEEATGRLIKAVEYANSLFSKFDLLIKLDDILIDKLYDIIETQKANQVVVTQVDTRLQHIGLNIIGLENSGLTTLFNCLLQPRDLIFYIGNKNVETMTSARIFSVDEFMQPSWELDLSKPCVVSSLQKDTQVLSSLNINSSNDIERVFNKLDYISKSLNNIYIVYQDDTDNISLDNSKFMQASISNLKNLVFFTTMHNRKAIQLNKLYHQLPTELHSIKMIINKSSKEELQNKAQFKEICGFKAAEYAIPYIKDLSVDTLKPEMLSKLRTIKQRIK